MTERRWVNIFHRKLLIIFVIILYQLRYLYLCILFYSVMFLAVLYDCCCVLLGTPNARHVKAEATHCGHPILTNLQVLKFSYKQYPH